MTILRRHLSTGFTVLPTATLEDSRLSFRARGILAYLVAKPDSWTVRTESIARAGREGRDAVREAVKELKALGYYRVITERHPNGQLTKVTEVYDTAQEWAAEEYAQQEARRLARRTAPQSKEADGAPEDGFSGVGSPGVGAPGAGGSGDIGSNQSQYSHQNPPTPTAGAAGEPGAAPQQAPAPPGQPEGCSAHPDRPGRSCRACGTSPRAQREEEKRAEREQFKERERQRNEALLTEVRRRPGGEGLSEMAQQRLAEIRAARRDGGGSGERVARRKK
ncbi:hypothetical protein ABZ705_30780 [Streptomyces sp. NPDC006984]|uniref:hypothetical protein n=1 Tax=Streptomyces sp. NPDC006984 TaxID=3155463 RepID=UPI0033D17121